MEIRQHSLTGPILSVQPLTLPRSSPHTPPHRPLTFTPGKDSSPVSRKVAAYRADVCEDQFDTLIESFHEWLAQHPSPAPSKHCSSGTATTYLHGDLSVCSCHSGDGGTHCLTVCMCHEPAPILTAPPSQEFRAIQSIYTLPPSYAGQFLEQPTPTTSLKEVGIAYHRLSMLSRALRTWREELK